MNKAKNIITPLFREIAADLKAGDTVLINSFIYTARDSAHKRMVAEYADTNQFPFDIKNQIIYYCGPAPGKPGRTIGSAGPTTSSRMDKYAPFLLDKGLTGMIGKGLRNAETVEAIIRNSAVYIGVAGGAGALISEKIIQSEIIAYEDLGAEAIYRFKVENLPGIVLIDSKGNNLYTD